MDNSKWVVKFMLNKLLCDTRSRGPSMQLLSEDAFNTEEEALKHYREKRAVIRFGGSPTHVVCYPVYVENYTPERIPSCYCDECGEAIYLEEAPEDGTTSDDGFTDLPNGNFCSKACFRNSFQSHDDDYDEEPHYED